VLGRGSGRSFVFRPSRPAAAENQFADLLESAFLDGIIDEETLTLAYLWLEANYLDIH
jgi:hypothetical protein